MTPDLWPFVISVAALLLSIHASRSARMARLAALRSEVRSELDRALVDAGRLVDRAIKMTEDTMKAAYDLRAADGSDFRPDEREAFDLRDDARLPLAELQQISPDMTGKSRKQLEATRGDVARIRRMIDEIGTRIDMKHAALDRLVDKAPTTGEASRPNAVLTLGPDARLGRNTP